MEVWTRSLLFFFFSSRRRHTRSLRDWSSDVCSSDLGMPPFRPTPQAPGRQRTRRSDREHQGHGPETHAPKGDAGRGVETPHRVPRAARGEERHATDARYDGAECKEATQGNEAGWRTGHAGSGGKVG